MSELIKEFLKRNGEKALNIHCVGDAMVDEYYEVSVNRISPEFPMPIMHSTDEYPSAVKPGGVANVAYQFKHFHACATLISFTDPIGNSTFGQHDLNLYQGDPHDWARLPIKRRFLDKGIQVKRHDIEVPRCGFSQEKLDSVVGSLMQSVAAHKIRPDIAILSDYNKGFFLSSTNFLDAYRDVITIVDPKKGPLGKWKGCTIFKPNATEAEALTGKTFWRDQAKSIQDAIGCKSVVITYHGEKVAGIEGNEYFCHTMDNKVSVDSVVGAGDCFCAFLAMAVGHGFSVSDAAQIAYQAGSIYVQHRMNRPVCPAELVVDGLVQPQDLVKRDFKLVFTNGCFDVLHKGHMETLKFAKSKGDKLVVALNSDSSIKRLKGNSRPIVPLEHRMAVMSSLKFVDFVVAFDEDTPLGVINQIKPDVLVKGSQYEEDQIVGADIVKEVYRAPMIDGVSTTSFVRPLIKQESDDLFEH